MSQTVKGKDGIILELELVTFRTRRGDWRGFSVCDYFLLPLQNAVLRSWSLQRCVKWIADTGAMYVCNSSAVCFCGLGWFFGICLEWMQSILIDWGSINSVFYNFYGASHYERIGWKKRLSKSSLGYFRNGGQLRDEWFSKFLIWLSIF